MRLYDLLGQEPAILDVTEARRGRVDLPVDTVVRIGRGGYGDPSGLVRGLLDGRDGWILVRPDLHVAWARENADGIEQAVRHALGR